MNECNRLTGPPESITIRFSGIDLPGRERNGDVRVGFYSCLDNNAECTSSTTYIAVVSLGAKSSVGNRGPLRAQNRSEFTTLLATLSSPSAVTTLNSRN